MLQELNQYLEDKVYLAGNGFTLADALMYYGIHHIIVSTYFYTRQQSSVTLEDEQEIRINGLEDRIEKLQPGKRIQWSGRGGQEKDRAILVE